MRRMRPVVAPTHHLIMHRTNRKRRRTAAAEEPRGPSRADVSSSGGMLASLATAAATLACCLALLSSSADGLTPFVRTRGWGARGPLMSRVLDRNAGVGEGPGHQPSLSALDHLSGRRRTAASAEVLVMLSTSAREDAPAGTAATTNREGRRRRYRLERRQHGGHHEQQTAQSATTEAGSPSDDNSKSSENETSIGGGQWQQGTSNFDQWLDRTTQRVLSPADPSARLSPSDVALVTTLMTSHARRSSVDGAATCERLLKRLVDEADSGNESVYVTTKMYTIAMDAWAKSQRRPLPGSSVRDGEMRKRRGGRNGRGGRDQQGPYGFEGRQEEGKNKARFNPRLSARPADDAGDDNARGGIPVRETRADRGRRNRRKNPKKTPSLPHGAAAHRAHRIHSSLVRMHDLTGDELLAPSTISYNAAINAWSKSYHPSAGEMAELLLCEMLDGWRFGRRVVEDDGAQGNTTDSSSNNTATDSSSNSTKVVTVVNDRVKPDVVTFTAVIDAWVKCTALAHDYHYSGPEGEADDGERGQRESYSDWRRGQAERADGLTRRAAERAKEILELMIALGHYDPSRGEGKGDGEKAIEELPFEPGMRPNCYTYSAVMNALAKSCSAVRAFSYSASSSSSSIRPPSSPDRPNNRSTDRRRPRKQEYNPAQEAQDMLERMIEGHARYRTRVGEDGVWRGADVARGHSNYANGVNEWNIRDLAADEAELVDPLEEDEELDDNGLGDEASSSVAKTDGEENLEPHWYDPRPDELSFPPNAVNYNSVLNAWSRASRYDPLAAGRAESMLLDRMEKPVEEGGDDVQPEALAYSLVINAWLRGFRGSNGAGTAEPGEDGSAAGGRRRRRAGDYTDLERIGKALNIVDRMEAWARRSRSGEGGGWNGGGGASENATVSGSAEGAVDDSDDPTDDILDDDELVQETATSTAPNIRPSIADPDNQLGNSGARKRDKARDIDAEVYNGILAAFSRETTRDHSADVMRLLDRMERLADELDMPSVRPNQRSYNVALSVIANSAGCAESSLDGYYASLSNEAKGAAKEDEGTEKDETPTIKTVPARRAFNPLHPGRAAESILSRMLSSGLRPDAYTFASVLNTYQRIPNGRLDAAMAADAVIRGMESLHLHGRIDDAPDVFHYTMACACWSRSGEAGVAGERCSEILRHMMERDEAGHPRVRPNIRTFNAVIDSHAYNGRVGEAEDMLLSMVDSYESSAARSMDGIEDEELPVRPDSFSFNTVIQQWARTRTPEGGRRAEAVLDRMLRFMNDGNADVRPSESSFAYIIFHYTKGAGRLARDAPDRALGLIRKMIGLYKSGYKELLPVQQNRTNPIFCFTSVIDAHSVLRRPDSGDVGEELLGHMTRLSAQVESLRPNTYAFLSVLYGWSSCGSVDAGRRATSLLERMEAEMVESSRAGEECISRTTQRCYILAQTAWARCPAPDKAEGALRVLEMMERSYEGGNMESRPNAQAYSMVLNSCAFADMVQDGKTGRLVRASPESQARAFEVAESTLKRVQGEPYPGVLPNPVIYGTFIKCCGRLDLPGGRSESAAARAFSDCCEAGLVTDFVLTQLRYVLSPQRYLRALADGGYRDVNRRGKSLSRDGKRLRRIRLDELPAGWTRNAEKSVRRDR